MDKNNLIKDTIVMSNIIELMRLTTSKTVSMCYDVMDDEKCGISIGPDFHAATIAALLGLDIIDDSETSKEGGEENDQ